MLFTNVEGRRNADGAIDLRFSTDTAVQTVSLDPEAGTNLLAVALMTAPHVLFEHDGFRIGRDPEDNAPVLSFRFGQDRWLSIRLGPLDLETLEEVLRRHSPNPPRPPAGA